MLEQAEEEALSSVEGETIIYVGTGHEWREFGHPRNRFITALAGQLAYSISVLSLPERGLSDDRLRHLLNIAPTQSIIIILAYRSDYSML